MMALYHDDYYGYLDNEDFYIGKSSEKPKKVAKGVANYVYYRGQYIYFIGVDNNISIYDIKNDVLTDIESEIDGPYGYRDFWYYLGR